MTTQSIDVVIERLTSAIDENQLCELYNSVGWTAYTKDPTVLVAAISGSDFVVTATAATQLVGLARCISDGETIVYIQDILVAPTHQNSGIGRCLVEHILDQYAHVRQKVLLTDDRPEQLRFYSSLGFTNTRELNRTPLNAFVIIEGTKLE